MQLFEMQGLLAGKCLPGDMKVNESLAEYLLRKLEDRNELERQLSAKTISEQKIINAFGISGEGAHSKLVIEYVHGLVSENAALRVAVDGVNSELYGKGFEVLGWHLNGDTEPLDSWFEDNDWDPETPATDAAIAEIKAQGVALAISHLSKKFTNLGVPITSLEWLEVELRAGRKG